MDKTLNIIQCLVVVERKRKALKITKKQLCETVGITSNMYWRYISSKSTPSFDTISQMLAVVGLKLLIVQPVDL